MKPRKLKRKKKQPANGSRGAEADRYFAQATEHKRQGRLAEAETLLRRALKKNPDHAEALNNLGNLLFENGENTKALTCYRKAADLLPGNHEILYNYATALGQSGRLSEATAILRDLLSPNPDNYRVAASLGVFLHDLGRLEEASSYLEKALALKPDYFEAHRFLALIFRDQGDLEAAVHQLRKSLKQRPDNALAWYLLSRYKKFKDPEDSDLASIHRLLAGSELPAEDRIFLSFSLGKIYDDLGHYPEAFSWYRQGNSLKRGSLGRTAGQTGFKLREITRVFTPDLFSRLSGCGTDSLLPVFIVGMPRSGTTLVEQIAASHSSVFGAGELKKLRDLTLELAESAGGSSTYPDCLHKIAPSRLNNLAKRYIQELATGLPGDITRVTDKMPTNFSHLGLIRLLFPKAQIIHCRRNPLDTCLSNYFQNFEEGNECSFSLDDLALYYRKYEALMAHWREVLPGGFLEIDYEDLVTNFETKAREIISYLELDWQESCLSFFKTRRIVHTSSDWQVRQPVYKTSVERWRNYEEFLEPLREGLAKKSPLY